MTRFTVEKIKLKKNQTARSLILLCGVLLSGVCDAAQAEFGPYDGGWESLQKMPVPAWFDDGKIGLFIHWGPYSAIGYRKGERGYAEHVPKMMCRDANHYYPYLKERWGAKTTEGGIIELETPLSDHKPIWAEIVFPR